MEQSEPERDGRVLLPEKLSGILHEIGCRARQSWHYATGGEAVIPRQEQALSENRVPVCCVRGG